MLGRGFAQRQCSTLNAFASDSIRVDSSDEEDNDDTGSLQHLQRDTNMEGNSMSAGVSAFPPDVWEQLQEEEALARDATCFGSSALPPDVWEQLQEEEALARDATCVGSSAFPPDVWEQLQEEEALARDATSAGSSAFPPDVWEQLQEEEALARDATSAGSSAFPPVVWEQIQEEEALARSHVSAARSRPASLSLSARASVFAARPIVRRAKYGVCSFCEVPKRLTLVKTGGNAGQIWTRCANFFVQRDGQPLCWHGGRWFGEVPRSLLRQQQEMKRDLRWQLRHGPAAHKRWERKVKICAFQGQSGFGASLTGRG